MASEKATRMNLLITKRKLKLASRGHKLLKEKRDALILEFFSTLREIKKLRSEIAGQMQKSNLAMQMAEAVSGQIDIERMALAIEAEPQLQLSTRNVMSVPVLNLESLKLEEQWHGLHESSILLDNAIAQYRGLFESLLRLSIKQLAFSRLAEEIKKTKRKVNSLEYIIIPSLEAARDSIQFKLEEMERENFIRLKMIKEKKMIAA